VYLLGNPIVWWGSSLAIGVYLAFRTLLVLRAQRGYRDFQQRELTSCLLQTDISAKIAFYDEVCAFLVMGWGLHYLPFFLMQRQLFLHHYLPALWFAIMLFCTVFDYATSSIRPRMRFQLALVVVIVALWSYNYFAPLAYAGPWTKAKCNSAKWIKSWDFSCADFHDNVAQYYPDSAIQPPNPKVYVDAGAASAVPSRKGDEPEPIHNVFDGGDDAAHEEKTMAPVGPVNEIQMKEHTLLHPAVAGSAAPVQADDRAPVGLDAGALEVTGIDDEGGWHGGANEDHADHKPNPDANKRDAADADSDTVKLD
jgi:dolichyl-phosphate-mannose-protein mannosyltransferase